MGIELQGDNSDRSSNSGTGGASPTRATAVVHFRVSGPAAMLSHAEMSRVLQRACARANIPVRYSEGFNPHPRLSLPLPRPVGVESEDELLVVRLCEDPAAPWTCDRAEAETAMVRALADQLPEGIDVLAVTLTEPNASFQPRFAQYMIPVPVDEDAELSARLTDEMTKIMASEHCPVERASGDRKAARRLDVRPFLRSIRLQDDSLIVEHTAGDAGSIRIDEILRLLELRMEDLSGPIRRVNVAWGTTEFQHASQQPRADREAEDMEHGTRDVD